MVNFNLNDSLIGGISSYATILLVVAYMNSSNLKYKPISPSRLLMRFLDYYGNYFLPNIICVSVCNEG